MVERGLARVRNAQDLLVFMEPRDPGSVEAVLSTLAPAVREVVESSPRTRWIPLEHDARFVDAIIGHYGVDGSVELFRDYTARFTESPLQRAIFEGARRIFGLSVGTFVRIMPRVWATSYKGAGQVDASEKGDHWQRVEIRDMHPAMCTGRGYAIMLRGLFHGMYRLADEDRVDFDLDFDRKARVLRAEFRWARAGG